MTSQAWLRCRDLATCQLAFNLPLCFCWLCPVEASCLLQVPVNFHIGNIGLAQDTDATQDSVPPFESGEKQLSLAPGSCSPEICCTALSRLNCCGKAS